MSSKELSDFVYAIEHSLTLREEITRCKNNDQIIEIAKKYGYRIISGDLSKDSIERRIDLWFRESKISPIRK